MIGAAVGPHCWIVIYGYCNVWIRSAIQAKNRKDKLKVELSKKLSYWTKIRRKWRVSLFCLCGWVEERGVERKKLYERYISQLWIQQKEIYLSAYEVLETNSSFALFSFCLDVGVALGACLISSSPVVLKLFFTLVQFVLLPCANCSL